MFNYDDLLKSLELKLKALVVKCQQLQFENQQLKQQLEKTNIQNNQLVTKQENLTEKLQLIQITKTIEKQQDVTDLKRRINDIVREIDKSIVWLNKMEDHE